MEEKSVVQLAQKFMKIFNVSPRNLGYHYLKKAAELVYNNPAIISGGKNGLYTKLSEVFPGTPYGNILRAISATLRNGFELTDKGVIHQYFGNVVSAKTGYPTSLVFIAKMGEYIRENMEGGGKDAK